MTRGSGSTLVEVTDLTDMFVPTTLVPWSFMFLNEGIRGFNKLSRNGYWDKDSTILGPGTFQSQRETFHFLFPFLFTYTFWEMEVAEKTSSGTSKVYTLEVSLWVFEVEVSSPSRRPHLSLSVTRFVPGTVRGLTFLCFLVTLCTVTYRLYPFTSESRSRNWTSVFTDNK